MENKDIVETCGGDEKSCPKCSEQQAKNEAHEEASFAVLIALVPALVLSFFSVSGLM